MTASLILGPRGRSQSRGTRTVAHWSRAPQPVQAMCLVAAVNAGADLRKAAVAALVAPVLRSDIPTSAETAMSARRRILVLDASAGEVVVPSEVSSAIRRLVVGSLSGARRSVAMFHRAAASEAMFSASLRRAGAR